MGKDKFSTCPHVSYIGDNSWQDIEEKKEKTETCESCNAEKPNLWLCLQSRCLYIGCGEKAVDHSTSHYEVEKHCLALNLTTMRIWCYSCEAEVIKNKNKPELVIRERSVISPSGSPTPENTYIQHYTPSPQRGGQSNWNDTVITETDESEDDDELKPKGLTGLQNIGNTCYMNAAIQALSNCQPLTRFFLDCPSSVRPDMKPHLSKSYLKLIQDMWHKRRPNYITPSGIAHGIKIVHPMFRGYSQQDTQEFLRCFMDQLHEELKQPMEGESVNDSGKSNNMSLHNVLEMHDELDRHSSMESSQSSAVISDGDYETCDSGLSSQQSSVSDINSVKIKLESANTKKEKINSSSNDVKTVASIDSGCGDVLENKSCQDMCKDNRDQTTSAKAGSSKNVTAVRNRTMSEATAKANEHYNISAAKKTRKTVQYKSVISDIFDGKILSSVQCLTCERVSSTKETFQDLSLPIPSPEYVRDVSASKKPGLLVKSSCGEVKPQGWIVWMYEWMKSWVWGPYVTLNDCLKAFFSTDELKGDNMYSCEKCKKLRNGTKYSEVLELPEILCIHLKRFRHEFMFSSKISSYVSFPIEGLNMERYLHKDCQSTKGSKYDLFAVICHHGTAGGGHYTSYAQNHNEQWYEFDDQIVSEVDPNTVASCQAYVLFYRKKTSPEIIAQRQEAINLMETDQHSLMKFYVSKEWVNKFNTFSDPGPITNHDFLCKHGGITPSNVPFVDDLVQPFTQTVWEYLHERYGGGPACTHLYPCETCQNEAQALKKRQSTELDMFIKLNEAFQVDENPPIIYAISMRWFKEWETFVKGNKSEAPGPIDNICISYTNRMGQKVLNKNSNYGQLSEEMWRFLHDTYSGGPELIAKQEVMSSNEVDNQDMEEQ